MKKLKSGEKEKIIQRIQKICEEKGFSAYSISQETSLTDEGINNVITGKTNPRNSTLQIIIEWLFNQGYSKQYLWEGTGDILSDKERDSNSFFNHKIELFNRMGVPVSDDEFVGYYIQNKERLLKNIVLQMDIKEMVSAGIIEYYEKDRRK